MDPVTEALPSNWCWCNGPAGAGPAVVFDVDGVISDASGRQHFLEGDRRRWDDFFDACGGDEPIHDHLVLTELLASGHTVVLLTARPVRVRPTTLDWLARHDICWDLLIMRGHDDPFSSARFKRGALEALERRGLDVRVVFEDDPRNVSMVRELGLPCVYVHSGYYDR